MNQPTTPPHDTNSGIDARVITAEDMDNALTDGTAIHLSQVMTGFARYRDTWWIAEIGRWLAVDDPDLIGFLDQHYAAAQAMQNLLNKQ